jgi:hypothetical protein
MVLEVKESLKMRGREIYEKFLLPIRRADGRQQTADSR